jgi:hypothetical protein
MDTRVTSVVHMLFISVVECLHGRHVSTSSRSSSGPNLRIQILHKLTHKMQVGVPLAYNVCEVKHDNINKWICLHREEFVICDSILSYKLKVGLVIGCVKTTERSDHIAILSSHYNGVPYRYALARVGSHKHSQS